MKIRSNKLTRGEIAAAVVAALATQTTRPTMIAITTRPQRERIQRGTLTWK